MYPKRKNVLFFLLCRDIRSIVYINGFHSDAHNKLEHFFKVIMFA